MNKNRHFVLPGTKVGRLDCAIKGQFQEAMARRSGEKTGINGREKGLKPHFRTRKPDIGKEKAGQKITHIPAVALISLTLWPFVAANFSLL